MCWPIALAAAAAVGGYQQSQAAKDSANYQAKVAENNRQTAEWQAVDAKARGDQAAADARRKYAQTAGSQVAGLAARGLDISEGSPNALLTDTDFFGQVDQNTIRANAAREAWGYNVQATNFANSAAAYRAQASGQNPLLSGLMSGASTYFMAGGSFGGNTLLTGSTSVSPRWLGGVNGSAGTAAIPSNFA